MQNKPSATFILNTSVLGAYTTPNSFGSTNNAWSSSFTWNNIDLRAILGDLYDQYDTWKIGLAGQLHNVSALTYATYDNRIGQLVMTGLDFKNCTMSSVTNRNTNQATIGYVNFATVSTTVGVVQNYNNLFMVNFSTSGNSLVNITLQYLRISDNAICQCATSTFPASTFIFKIYPI